MSHSQGFRIYAIFDERYTDGESVSIQAGVLWIERVRYFLSQAGASASQNVPATVRFLQGYQ